MAARFRPGTRLQRTGGRPAGLLQAAGATGGRLRCFVSGGAPLNAEIARFFYAAGMPILEGYGLTETSPVIAVNTFRGAAHRHGRAADARRRGADRGGRRDPDPRPQRHAGLLQQARGDAEALDPDGWFHTGDIGELDADGYLIITDRKKDLIVTAGGKNIAPQPIENLARSSKFVSTPSCSATAGPFPSCWSSRTIELLRAWAARHDYTTSRTRPGWCAPRPMRRWSGKCGSRCATAHYEMPKKFLLIAEDFSVESGELTPKLKRAPSRRRAALQDRIEAPTRGRTTGHLTQRSGAPPPTGLRRWPSSPAMRDPARPPHRPPQTRQHHARRLAHPRSAPSGAAEHHPSHRLRLERQARSAQHAETRLIGPTAGGVDRDQADAGKAARTSRHAPRWGPAHQASRRFPRPASAAMRIAGKRDRVSHPAAARRRCRRRHRRCGRNAGTPGSRAARSAPSGPPHPGGRDEKLLVMVGGTAEVVGQLDEHQGLNTTQVSLPASTVTGADSFFPRCPSPSRTPRPARRRPRSARRRADGHGPCRRRSRHRRTASRVGSRLRIP